ncbi:hypothetical protein FRB90_001487 [Tulasnella sp. 427]|nr:hypothetical protein FRB90_001487 [Tulasnella sp. 427]
MVATIQRKPRAPQEQPPSLSKWHDPKKMRQRGGIFKPSAENKLIDLLLAIPQRPGEPRSTRKTPRSKTPGRRAAGSGQKGHGTTNYHPPSSPLLAKSAIGKARKSKASLSRRSTKGAEIIEVLEVEEDEGVQHVDGPSETEMDHEPLRRSTRRTPGRKLAPPPEEYEGRPVAALNVVRRRSSKKFKELAPETSDPPIAIVDLQSSVRSKKQAPLSPIVESPLVPPAPPPLKKKSGAATKRPQVAEAEPITKTKAPGKRKKQDDDAEDLASPAKRPRTDTTGGVRQTPSRAAKHKAMFDDDIFSPAPAPLPPKFAKPKPSIEPTKSINAPSKSTSQGKKNPAPVDEDRADLDLGAIDAPAAKSTGFTAKSTKAKVPPVAVVGDEVDDAALVIRTTKKSSKGKKAKTVHDLEDVNQQGSEPSAKALGKRKAEEPLRAAEKEEQAPTQPKAKGKKSATKPAKKPKKPASNTKRKPQEQRSTGRKKRKVEPESDEEEDGRDFVDVVVKTKAGDDESTDDEQKGGKGRKGGSKSKARGAKKAPMKRKAPPPRPSMFVKAEAAYLDSEADPMDLLG